MPSDIQLRSARADDALCLSMLATQVFLDTYATEGIRPALVREVCRSYGQAQYEKALVAGDTRIEVAERNGHLIGFAQITLGASHALAPSGVQAELLRLYVQEPFTGMHLGTRLLARAEEIAAAHGASVLWLTPWVHNHRALAFYARRSYIDYGRTEFILEGESHENLVVAKVLRSAAA
jgi:ribosomal protein S18 acetylase RimI-like enzyme